MENETLEIPKFTPHPSSGDDGKCPRCHGTGWILYEVNTAAALSDVYGDLDMNVDYVKKCTYCTGERRSADMTGVPDLFRDADISKFDFNAYSVDMSNIRKIVYDMIQNFGKWQIENKGLYLYSKTPGSGKSFLAACIGKSIMVKYDMRFRFVTSIDYIDKVAEGYSIKKNGGFDDPSKIYRECEILVVDDIGAQIGKDWQKQELFKLINTRNSQGLPTIYTSNFSIEKLDIDERTKSRIYKDAIPIQMPEESIRQQRATSEQNRFLEGILNE